MDLPVTYTLIRPLTSADVDRALADQRERIAAGIETRGCLGLFSGCVVGALDLARHLDRCPLVIAAAIRSGEIGGG